MSSFRLYHRLQLLVALALVKAIALIAIAMVLYFRGQWMQQTDQIVRELAETCSELQTIGMQNREAINALKKRQVTNE